MKKVVALVLIVLSLAGYAVYYFSKEETLNKEQFLRIHIRANSNNEEDQRVKYVVKDAIVERLYSVVAECETKQELINAINTNKNELEKLANDILRENNFTYNSSIKVCEEYFPTRVYNDSLKLESGVYDAIIVGLGNAEGNNWWCVVYPPLCFTDVSYNGSCKLYYKSKIAEIIKEFFG